MFRIAIDFDETLTEYRPFPEKAPLRKEAVEFIKEAHANGHVLYLWTTRKGKYYVEAIERLKEEGLWQYFTPVPLKQGKIEADFYIDDKATASREVAWQEWLDLVKGKKGMIKNTQRIKMIIMQPSAICYCPLGDEFYTNKFEIAFEPDKLIPDYCEMQSWIDENITGKKLIIEDAVQALYDYMMRFEPTALEVSSDVTDAVHFPVTVIK